MAHLAGRSTRVTTDGASQTGRGTRAACIRVVGGREVRIEAAPGGVDVAPLDAETEPVVRALLGLAFELEPFYAWAAERRRCSATIVPRLAGFRPR